jgi:adenylate cyclase
MITLKERARVATATLQSALQIAPVNFDADQTAAIVEQAIKNATRERDSLARHRLREAQTAARNDWRDC